jgi:hypothetical protein
MANKNPRTADFLSPCHKDKCELVAEYGFLAGEPKSQAKLFREMYDKGFDAGKEAMRQKLNKFLSDNL